MTTAKEIMTSHVECVGENQTLAEAARMMRDLDVGALPICGEDDRLHGITWSGSSPKPTWPGTWPATRSPSSSDL